jgi:hypothetical protein
MRDFRKNLKGYSLVELVLAIGIFAIISSMLVLLVVDATRTLDNTRTRARATHLTQEVSSALIMMKNQSWYQVARHTDKGEKYLEFMDGDYQILDGQGEQGELTYSFTITRAMRENGVIVASGGSLDPHTRLVSISVSWRDRLGREHNINPKIYINDWNTHSFISTTQEDFDLGLYTDIESITDGAIRLKEMEYADWCRPTLSMATYDLPRNGIATSISAYGQTVLMGTGGNASGLPFIKATVTEDPPGITVDESFSSQDKVNDVFLLDENYALLATDTGSKEVIILDLNPSVQEVGLFNIPIQTRATTVYAYENKGFVTERNNLIIFDLTSPLGSRPQLASISLGGLANKTMATDIYVDEQYIYLTLDEHTQKFAIYQHSPTLQLVGQINLGDMGATALFISEDTTRAYVGTKDNAAHEFFILDITNKSSPTLINSMDLGGISVRALISMDNRVMIGGTGGEEYKVIDITDENNLVQCGSLNIDTGINDIALVKTALNNYSYILTGNSNDELQIIRGGTGGGGADGLGYLPYGEYLSTIFDSQSEDSEYYIISITGSIPEGTSSKLQIRVGNNPDLSSTEWLGPDGTSSTYYESAGVFDLPPGLRGRYAQYKITLESDLNKEFTPLIEEIVINYEK